MSKLSKRKDTITYLLALSDLVGGSTDLSACHGQITRISGLEEDKSLAARKFLLNAKKLEGKDLTETRITKKGLKTVEAIFNPLRERIVITNLLENDCLVAEGDVSVDDDIYSYISEFYLLMSMLQFVTNEVKEFAQKWEIRSERKNIH